MPSEFDVVVARELVQRSEELEHTLARVRAESLSLLAEGKSNLDPARLEGSLRLQPLDRLALTAAASGAAVVVRAGGPAAWVLGERATIVDPADPSSLSAVCHGGWDGSPSARQARAQTVLGACGPAASAALLRRLVSAQPADIGRAA